MTIGFPLLRFVRQILDLIGGHRSRLDMVSLEVKLINGNGNTPRSSAEKAADINSSGLDFAVRGGLHVGNFGDIIAVFVSQPFADDIVALHVRQRAGLRSRLARLLSLCRFLEWLFGGSLLGRSALLTFRYPGRCIGVRSLLSVRHLAGLLLRDCHSGLLLLRRFCRGGLSGSLSAATVFGRSREAVCGGFWPVSFAWTA